MSLLVALALLTVALGIGLAVRPGDLEATGELEAEDWAELDERP